MALSAVEIIYSVGERRMDEQGVFVESYGEGRAKHSMKAPSQYHFAQRNCHTGWSGIQLGSLMVWVMEMAYWSKQWPLFCIKTL